MTEETKRQMIYLVAVDVLRRLLKQGVDRKILDRLNRRNAEKMHCSIVELI